MPWNYRETLARLATPNADFRFQTTSQADVLVRCGGGGALRGAIRKLLN
jgi:hypothetical protein